VKVGSVSDRLFYAGTREDISNLTAAFCNFGNAHNIVRICRNREKIFKWLIGREVMELITLAVVLYLDQYSETNVMHFLLSLLRIQGLYMFRALLVHLQKALHKQHLVYCVRVMSVGCWCSQLT
jgi:hypothetical protein